MHFDRYMGQTPIKNLHIPRLNFFPTYQTLINIFVVVVDISAYFDTKIRKNLKSI
jgi:hypothetical protein